MKKFSSFVFCFVFSAVFPSTILSQGLDTLGFKGHYRAKPKTSIVRKISTSAIASPKQYPDLDALINAFPKDVDMRQKYPDLNKKQSGFPNQREPEELKNIEVHCWIHAVKIENGSGGDNDFHVVVGDKADTAGARFLNIEVSGLPVTGKDRGILKQTRQQLLSLLNGINFTSSFTHVIPAKKVRIKGSLFFDGDHQAGCNSCPGPSYAKPQTVWEVHPVFSIVAIQ